MGTDHVFFYKSVTISQFRAKKRGLSPIRVEQKKAGPRAGFFVTRKNYADSVIFRLFLNGFASLSVCFFVALFGSMVT